MRALKSLLYYNGKRICTSNKDYCTTSSSIESSGVEVTQSGNVKSYCVMNFTIRNKNKAYPSAFNDEFDEIKCCLVFNEPIKNKRNVSTDILRQLGTCYRCCNIS